MECDTYSIELIDGAWALRLNGRVLEHFEDPSEAERAAGAASRMSERRGRIAEVRVQSDASASLT